MRTIRIGAGAGFSGDRIEPAVELAEKGDVQYLVFECLAERTIALAQQARMRDPAAGYDPLLAARMRAVLRPCRERGIRIVTNMGAANPVAAAEAIAAVARDLGLHGLRIAAVTGDDVLEAVRAGDHRLDETGEPVSALADRLVSANAYLGAGPIAAALAQGAEVVVTGRAADPAMFLAPLVHEFGWSMTDWTRLGRGTVVGHLLECAGQVTGGYFADPGCKDVPDLARLGFPLAEVAEDGTAVVTKVPGSGGRVTTATCKEQLLYEVHDPARYLQPDVVADFSGVRVSEDGPDRVRIEGGGGAPRTGLLKVSVGYRDSWVGEGQISYAGAGAVARGRLALEIVAERLRMTGVACRETRFELIGVDAILGPALSAGAPEPREVRVRVVGRTDSRAEAERIGQEVESLYLNGPAGGGGATKSAREIVGIRSLLLPEGVVTPAIHVVES
ncbi:ABC transporter substrate-binding protein [Methylobacterium variabile]|uniref:ABC transporter substrate-binding protein n=1 Tax=Methylobacterium variabile TaxID=298794 RepID=A0A0J6SUG5_9HYPH|nr:acyclic terpene utilization AtuA family protein [Methylobacterium variabile]KMO38920.1 ABC transporter substrate-binding protein [Methylobacterium variabile]